MHYWNKNNFEGLESVGEKYSSIEGYELFGVYCLQKGKGLKKQAVASIKEFVSNMKAESVEKQRAISEELSELAFHNREIHQLLAYPLLVYLEVVLEQWQSDDPRNPTPLKWLGYIDGDVSYYERALKLDPRDEVCISRIAQAHLNDVDHQTHHLSESQFLGDFNEAKNALLSARSLIERLSTECISTDMQSELDYYDNLLSCWQEYSSLDIDEPFPKWCASKGKKFNFWSIVYYDKQ